MTLTIFASPRIKVSFLLGAALLFSSSGCVRSNGVLTGTLFRARETSYHIGEVPETWRRVSLRGADLGFVHDNDGSTLLLNSNCKDLEDTPLVALSFHLIIGMTEQNIIEQKKIQLSEREALETTAEAKLDGVKRKLKILVLKKNSCIYDVVYSAPPEKFDENLAAYDSMRKNFSIVDAK